MSKRDEYRQTLRDLAYWDAYLLAESGLPGRRANLELAHAVSDLAGRETLLRFAACTADLAPANSPDEFLAFCGVEGLGRLIAEGHDDLWHELRHHALDPRWRLREAVAMALQRVGGADKKLLVDKMRIWAHGSPLERRAAIAGLCEPGLLHEHEHALATLDILDAVTLSLTRENDRRSEAFRALRKGLGYCWSVAVVALPDIGKERMAAWLACEDHDVRWVMRENLKKRRLERMDAAWVAEARDALARSRSK